MAKSRTDDMNSTYHAPLEDSIFLLSKVLNWNTLFAFPGFKHVDEELAKAILTEGAKFTSEILAPLNEVGDREGSRLVDGKVITPEGFKEAYNKFKEAGWSGLDMPEEYGGQDLPISVQVAFAEMINGACISFGMLPIMQRAAATLLLEHGDAEIVGRVVSKLVSGDWGATICITEAQAGSDVGRIKTTASLQEDGSYRLSGSKIFISYGDQDLTAQITHLVLARMPDAPAGTRGISLFLVPKINFDSDSHNNVSVSRLEKKMGLKASPTCVLDLDDAVGYRIGEENRGLHCMFTMVNLMRLEVSIQGPAIAAAACNKAIAYANERLQGGAADKKAIAIIEHADVRRMLFIMRARTEAMRALVFEAAFNLDIAKASPDKKQADSARKLAEFLLPVCKAAGSQTGFEVANLAIQVLGGHGYISDYGVEQYARDVRVSMIYEGSNGIQALDLVTRKLLKDEGQRYTLFINRVEQDIAGFEGLEHIQLILTALRQGLQYLSASTDYFLNCVPEARRDVEAGATDYLNLLALVASSWMWLRISADVDESTEFGRSKIAVGNFHAEHIMPECQLLSTRVMLGANTIDSISGDILGT
jgi:alkylation response protein AidB-like acyl-CoA dehydrogenase